MRTTSDDRVRGDEQRQDLHRLRRHREPQQPAVDRDREEAQQRVGQRVLAEQRAAGARPSAGRTGRPTPTPTRRGWCTFQNTSTSASEVGHRRHRGRAARMLSSERDAAACDQTNSGLTGSSSWSVPRGMIIARAPLLARLRRACAVAGVGSAPAPAAAASARRAARAPARGARRRPRPPAPARCGRSRSRPCGRRRDLGDRQARRVDAVDARGREQVADLHVGVAGHEAQLQRRRRRPRRRRPRCARWVRGVEHRDRGVLVGQQRDLATTAGRRASPGRARRPR